MPLPAWAENDLENLFAADFNDGPLVYQGQSTGCIMRVADIQASGLGHFDLVDRVIGCHYATAALPIAPTVGVSVTVAGASYMVRHKMDKDGGESCLYLTAAS